MTFLFLDTTILQVLNVLGEAIYDNYLSPETEGRLRVRHGDEFIDEAVALRDIFFVARRGSLPIAMSVQSVREFLRTPDVAKRESLYRWGTQMLEWWEQNGSMLMDERVDAAGVKESILASGKLSFLPHTGDQALIAEALALGCDTFLTLDKRTILRFRDRLVQLGIDALSPKGFVLRHQSEMAGA